ncbi:hypothetical protein GF312_17740 [Candidatus Poribacteria bacterium]|nr:hypothetical protein [Candidatus Poribacteria bacterium]
MKNKLLLLLLTGLFLVSANISRAYKTIKFNVTFGGKGETEGKISSKTRFAFDKKGGIYILDIDNLRVQKFDEYGNFVMQIESGEDFIFSRPMDLTLDGDMNIYVIDWKSLYINGSDDPKIFNYGLCIHKFSSEGKFIKTLTLHDLSQKNIDMENAVPAVDTDGNFALMIVQKDVDRDVLLSADSDGNLYILDQKKIYRLSESEKAKLIYPGSSEYQMVDPTAITVGINNNIYVADSGIQQIFKFDTKGNFLTYFGKRGDDDGQFIGDIYISTLLDGSLMVADSSEYKKRLNTVIKNRQIIDSTTTIVTGQNDPIIPDTKDFYTIIKRVQKFDQNGKFIEKILYRFDMSDPDSKELNLKAIDPTGNIYMVHKTDLTINKYQLESPISWSQVDKTFSCRVLSSESRLKIDNFYDLNSYTDFDEREKYTQITATAQLNYNVTEKFRVTWTGAITRFLGKTYNNYPGEYDDPYGYIQDDETTDDYTAGRIRIDLGLVLDHNPFRYRMGNFFVYLAGGRYKFDIRATDFQNRRELDEDLWWLVWASGFQYDMGRAMRLSMIVAQHRPPGFMNYEYKYWDEQGELYNTGYGNGSSTEISLILDGVF